MKENKKTAAIVSLYGNSNFGNKLQNYAVQRNMLQIKLVNNMLYLLTVCGIVLKI